MCITGLTLLASLLGGGSAQAVDSTTIARVIEAQMRWSRLPGVAVAVVRPDQEVYAAGFSRDGEDITADSPFLLGSVTKTFTALAVVQLADARRLRFDDPVSKYLPAFAPRGFGSGSAMTLRHLLTHTSGFTQWSGHDRRAQRVGHFNHIELARPPGAAFEYSSLNYIVLGQVVEAVSGLRYGEYVQRHIFEPLEMRNSFTDLESARRGGLVRSYRYFFGAALPGSEQQQPDPLVPAGFLISSARDLGKYLRMLMNDGRFGARQVVSSAGLREMFATWNGEPLGAGMAWGVGATSIGHAGSTPTFSARLSILPAERHAIVLLANVNSGPFFPGTGAVMDGVTRVVRGRPAAAARPDEILLKLALLVMVAAGGVRWSFWARRWARSGYPRRLTPTRRTLSPLIINGAAACIVLVALPRWIGVPVLTIVEYFPDLGIAMIAGAVTGPSAALLKSLVVAAGIQSRAA